LACISGRISGDLVEQKAAAVRPLEASLAAAIRTCKGPAFVAEQFAFDQAFRDRRAIDCHVRSVSARRPVVDGACGQLFPRTPLASDDHRRARRSGFFDQAYWPGVSLATDQPMFAREVLKITTTPPPARSQKIIGLWISCQQVNFSYILLLTEP
jgi:hypothetical protein